jgi:stage II sporulation protein D
VEGLPIRNAGLALFVALGFAAGVARAEPAIRVRVLEGASSVRLAGEGLRAQSRSLPGGAAVARPRRGRVEVAGLPLGSRVPVAARRGVRVNGREFPGSVLLLERDGALDVVNVVGLEPYVEGTIAGEVYPSWPSAVLKAQAVIARTYALHQIRQHAGEPWDMESSVVSQRYRGGGVPERARRAARETRGEYLSFEGAPILAVYHSSAGGRTASAREVWGEDLAYLPGVPSPDDDAPDYFWSYEISRANLAAALRDAGIGGPARPDVQVLERGPSGRVARVRIGDAVLAGRDLRRLLGGAAIRSSLFDVRTDAERVRFLGSGAGHGVGLSQWGARALAAQGASYEEILRHYYPGSRLVRGPLADLGASR